MKVVKGIFAVILALVVLFLVIFIPYALLRWVAFPMFPNDGILLGLFATIFSLGICYVIDMVLGLLCAIFANYVFKIDYDDVTLLSGFLLGPITCLKLCFAQIVFGFCYMFKGEDLDTDNLYYNKSYYTSSSTHSSNSHSSSSSCSNNSSSNKMASDYEVGRAIERNSYKIRRINGYRCYMDEIHITSYVRSGIITLYIDYRFYIQSNADDSDIANVVKELQNQLHSLVKDVLDSFPAHEAYTLKIEDNGIVV